MLDGLLGFCFTKLCSLAVIRSYPKLIKLQVLNRGLFEVQEDVKNTGSPKLVICLKKYKGG